MGGVREVSPMPGAGKRFSEQMEEEKAAWHRAHLWNGYDEAHGALFRLRPLDGYFDLVRALPRRELEEIKKDVLEGIGTLTKLYAALCTVDPATMVPSRCYDCGVEIADETQSTCPRCQERDDADYRHGMRIDRCLRCGEEMGYNGYDQMEETCAEGRTLYLETPDGLQALYDDATDLPNWDAQHPKRLVYGDGEPVLSDDEEVTTEWIVGQVRGIVVVSTYTY